MTTTQPQTWGDAFRMSQSAVGPVPGYRLVSRQNDTHEAIECDAATVATLCRLGLVSWDGKAKDYLILRPWHIVELALDTLREAA